MSKSTTRPERSPQPTKNQPTKNQPTKNQRTRTAQGATTPRTQGRRPLGTSKAGVRPTGGNGATKGGTSRSTPSSGPKVASFRSRHPLIAALVPVGLVVAAIATMVVLKATGGSSPPASSSHLTAGGSAASADPGTSAVSPSVLAALTVAPTTLDAVGSPASVVPPSRVGGSGTVLRGADGKPVITYVGAEFCPYCAAERWALAVALSRFGTFSHLSGTQSASDDVYPNTQTLSFYGSSYSSSYVDFQPVEEATNQRVGNGYQTLQTPTAAQSSLLSTYDSAGSIPFLDMGNKFVITGASYSPQVLQGLSRAQIAAQLNDPKSAVGQAIDGTANDITAAICTLTGNQPSNVCSSPTISAIAKNLAG